MDRSTDRQTDRGETKAPPEVSVPHSTEPMFTRPNLKRTMSSSMLKQVCVKHLKEVNWQDVASGMAETKAPPEASVPHSMEPMSTRPNLKRTFSSSMLRPVCVKHLKELNWQDAASGGMAAFTTLHPLDTASNAAGLRSNRTSMASLAMFSSLDSSSPSPGLRSNRSSFSSLLGFAPRSDSPWGGRGDSPRFQLDNRCDTPPSGAAAFELHSVLARCPAPKLETAFAVRRIRSGASPQFHL